MNKITNVIKLKSKTINYNGLYLAIVAMLPALGIAVKPELVAAGQTILNVVLRFMTESSLEDK